MSNTILDKKTLIPVSIAISIIVSFLASWGWLNNQFVLIHAKIDLQIKASDKRFDSYERRLERVETRAASAWTKVDEILWVSEFRRMNPDMKIPETRRD